MRRGGEGPKSQGGEMRGGGAGNIARAEDSDGAKPSGDPCYRRSHKDNALRGT